jgi:tRNA(Ile)-lysidine synthetase-like protein
MINILGNIPNKITVACSGGPDSMAILSFLSSHGKRDVSVAYFNHGTLFGKGAEVFIRGYCLERELPLSIGMIGTIDRGDKSTEEHWRDERAAFLEGIEGTVVTGHNLDDVIEWYLFSTLHGQSKLIPYQRNNVIRPFLTTTKNTLEQWCDRHDVPYIVDPGNKDEKYMRSIVRHKILPEALRVNPGLEKVIRRKLNNRANMWDV